MDISEKAIRRERITKIFLKELGVNEPSPEQLEFLNKIRDSDLSGPIVIKMKEQGMSFGEISKRLGINLSTLKNKYFYKNKKRFENQTANTEN